MIIGQSELRRRMDLPIADPESIVVTPILDDDAIDSDSIDLCLNSSP